MFDRSEISGYTSSPSLFTNREKLVKKGSIIFHKDRARHSVSWWCGFDKRTYVITKYKGLFMPCNQLSNDRQRCMNPLRCDGYKIAEKLLHSIQNRLEEHLNGQCQFRIEEFTGKNWSDVLDYYENWMKHYIEKKRKPGTINPYWSYFRNWIKPFFTQHPVKLHEIRASTLDSLLNFIVDGLKKKHRKPDTHFGKYAQNVLYAFHSMMDYARRDERIMVLPPFPRVEDYKIVEPRIEWLDTNTFWNVINSIESHHQSIFLWMYFHIMREAEAYALQWEDWDELNKVFYVKRGISARKVVQSTKTDEIYVVPCHSEFLPYLNTLKKRSEHYNSKFIFTNPRARRASKRYTNESINNVWKKACKKVGVSIRPYAGTRHSRASQMHNELGMTIHEIKEAGSWKRLDSVRRYAKTEIERKRKLLERNLEQHRETHTKLLQRKS